jgi:hypothetical protein
VVANAVSLNYFCESLRLLPLAVLIDFLWLKKNPSQ